MGDRTTLAQAYKHNCNDAAFKSTLLISQITSRGPGTAFEYGFKLLELLKGKETRDKLASDMICT